MSDRDSLDLLQTPYSSKFKESCEGLLVQERILVISKCELWRKNPKHGALEFRKTYWTLPVAYRNKETWYFRAGLSLRVLVYRTDVGWMLEFVGRHKNFD